MKFLIETDRETDGRWIAEIPALPGAMQYGNSREEALGKAQALALRILAERIEHGGHPVQPIEIYFAAA
jgi:predicted RNase H-like HicB family nuclease